MPQNPVQTTLFVSQLKAGTGISLTPANGTGIVTVAATALPPIPAAKFSADTVQSSSLQVSGITGAQLCTVSLTGTTPGAVKFPAAAAIISAIPNAAVGEDYSISLLNQASTSVQLTGKTATILSGPVNINPTSSRQLNLHIDSLSSITLTGLTSTQL